MLKFCFITIVILGGGGGGGAARKRYAKKSLVSTQQNCELTDTGDKTAVGNYHKNVKENSL